MAITIQIEDIDTGWRATKRALAGLDGVRADAGLFSSKEAFKGALHELGGKQKVESTGELRIKPRPWLSIAADSNFVRLGAMAAKAVEQVADRKKTAKQALRPIAKFMADEARSVIEQRRVGGPELAASTIDRKGHDQKLVDTGDMLDAIDFAISQDGEDDE